MKKRTLYSLVLSALSPFFACADQFDDNVTYLIAHNIDADIFKNIVCVNHYASECNDYNTPLYDGNGKCLEREFVAEDMQPTSCITSSPSFLEAHDLEEACGRWFENAPMHHECIRFMAVGHCLAHAGGLWKNCWKRGIEIVLADMANAGDDIDAVKANLKEIADHGPVQEQLGGEIAYATESKELIAVDEFSNIWGADEW